ncbi:MAG: methylated-DNA--[protein]-cysteine S-methyltransferase [Fibromonadaceae bacterium]|nr:methylated-DNA--[protein]-cysteine S-methyltransferase [Fibromonadaceae bacterium]
MDYTSPIGVLRIEASERGLRAIRFISSREEPRVYVEPQSENGRNSIALCISTLNMYFAKQWGAFEQLRLKIPLDLKGTDLQKKVWGVIYSMPNTFPIVGMSYSELASLAGKPNAVRACANICGQNSIPILIPCHRIIPVSGKLGGYTGGISKKAWLLWHEGTTPNAQKPNVLLQQPPQAR